MNQLDGLVSPAGLVRGTRVLDPVPGVPSAAVATAPLGVLTEVLPELRIGITEWRFDLGIDGAGSALDPDRASRLAVAEALERYSSCAYSPDQFIWASADELGDEAIDLESCPRISAAEAAYPGCPITVPDRHAPLRWVRGVSLRSGRVVWIPAIMVYLHLPFSSRGERITLPITTGCAAHTDLHLALAKGACEVVERDAIALTWLQRLPLPRIELDEPGEEITPLLRQLREGRNIEVHLFDATTDIGIPTVYAVEVARYDARVRTHVACATDPDPHRCVAKVFRESASGRIALRARRATRTDPGQFIDVFDGAIHMSAPERQGAFDFLLRAERAVRLSSMARPAFDSGRDELRYVLERLAAAGHEAFAVDLTTDEAVRVGMRVVKVLIPSLQPLSFSTRAQFRGHPRLYHAPAAMGHPVHAEADLNPWPQPFA